MHHFKSTLPLKNGVAASFVNLPHGRGLLLDFLLERFPQTSAALWQARMARGEVVNQDGVVLCATSLCAGNRSVFYYREVEFEARIPFDEQILFRDAHLLVVDKPHFLPVTPAGEFLHETLLTRLRLSLNLEHISPIHRLDKDTAGVILFAIDPRHRGAYQALFAQHKAHKIYHALAPTRIDLNYPLTYSSRLVEDETQFFKMRETSGAANSSTHITLLAPRGNVSVYQLEPQTGKKHQLRAHMNALNMPIVNDAFYPVAHAFDAVDYSKPLQLLAKSIAFIDPITGEPRKFESPREL